MPFCLPGGWPILAPSLLSLSLLYHLQAVQVIPWLDPFQGSDHPQVCAPIPARKAPHSPVFADLSTRAEMFLSTSQPLGLCSCCSLCQEHPFSLLPPFKPILLARTTSVLVLQVSA